MELSPEARAKSAFVTPLDKFEFTRCPFGLSQAPAYFQRLMNQVIKGLPFAFVYLDDVLIHSPDIETHLKCHGLKIWVFYFFYISKTLQMIWISFMASLLNAVL